MRACPQATRRSPAGPAHGRERTSTGRPWRADSSPARSTSVTCRARRASERGGWRPSRTQSTKCWWALPTSKGATSIARGTGGMSSLVYEPGVQWSGGCPPGPARSACPASRAGAGSRCGPGHTRTSPPSPGPRSRDPAGGWPCPPGPSAWPGWPSARRPGPRPRRWRSAARWRRPPCRTGPPPRPGWRRRTTGRQTSPRRRPAPRRSTPRGPVAAAGVGPGEGPDGPTGDLVAGGRRRRPRSAAGRARCARWPPPRPRSGRRSPSGRRGASASGRASPR